MKTRSANKERLPTAQDAVFNNDLIRDLILYYVIHDKNKAVISEVGSARLVNKAWLQSVSRNLRKSKKLVYRIRLTQENSTVGTAYVKRHGKMLNQLEKVLTCGVLKTCIPELSIRALPSFFHHRNHQQMLTFLAKYGSHLVEMHITFEEKQILKPLKSGTSLSSLRVLQLCVTRTKVMDQTTAFIQSVFDACEQLVSLTLMWRPTFDGSPPKTLSNLVLPTSITDMTFECPFLYNQLDLLVENPLPNLQSLKLKGFPNDSTGGQIFNVLENHRETLKSFCVQDDPVTSWRSRYPPSIFTMPVMPSLKCLNIETGDLELMTDGPAIQHFLPAVQHLTLTEQTAAMFHKWTSNSRFDSVTSLTVSWCNSRDVFSGESNMDIVPKAFPNLCKLSLTTEVFEALTESPVVWKNLSGLRELRICMLNYGLARDKLFWEELFTGLSPDQSEALKNSTKHCNELLLFSTPSIRSLTDLEELHLEATETYGPTLLSDAMFRFAFLKMPKLSKLVLVGSFSASEEMTKAWIQKGRSIEYHIETQWNADE